MNKVIGHPHVASTVLMVRPVDFSYNEQTATDNEFQHMPIDIKAGEVNRRALKEFEICVEKLRNAGVEVIVMEGPENDNEMRIKTPDAVFCNNWFSTHPSGEIYLYPLSTPNRREEVKRIDQVKVLLEEHGFLIKNVSFIGEQGQDQKFLESTGSMVFDHVNRIVYAARSIRMHDELLEKFIQRNEEYRSVVFDTVSSHGLPFYHTNVMMSVGDRFAVVCSESIVENDRQRVLEELKQTKHVIEISLEQAEKFFCGNILQLRNQNQDSIIAMSASCIEGFSQDQLQQLESFGVIVDFPITDTIEFVGGGSARCMLGEIFLPRVA